MLFLLIMDEIALMVKESEIYLMPMTSCDINGNSLETSVIHVDKCPITEFVL